MKKSKVGIIVGCCIGFAFILAGIIVGVIFGFSVDKINWDGSLREANENFTATADCSSLSLDAEAGDVYVIYDDVEKITVDYFTDDKIKVEVSEKNGTLSIEQNITFSLFATYGGEITVRIPQNKTDISVEAELAAGTISVKDLTVTALDVDLDAGEAEISNVTAQNLKLDVDAGSAACKNSVANTAELSVDAGEITLQNCAATVLFAEVDAGEITANGLTSDKITASVSAGEITLNLTGVKAEYTLTKNVSLGSCNFNEQTGTTDKYVKAKVSMGEINVTFAA